MILNKEIVQDVIDRLLYCEDYLEQLTQLNAKFEVNVRKVNDVRIYGKQD